MLAFAHQGAELVTIAASVQLSWCSLGKQPCLQQHVAGNITASNLQDQMLAQYTSMMSLVSQRLLQVPCATLNTV